MSQGTSLIAAVVPSAEMGIASSILALARNIAGAFGIALFTSILNNATESSLVSIAHYSIIHTTTPSVHAEIVSLMETLAQIDGFRAVFVIASLIMVAAAVLTLFTINIKEEKRGVQVMID
jgi:uncharacterized membrane protein